MLRQIGGVYAFMQGYLTGECGGSRGSGPGRRLYAEAAVSGGFAVMALCDRVVA
jgi:hypothetical protein